MPNFKRHSNGFIYLYQWIDRHNYFRITTKMKVDESDWNESRKRPKNSELTYNGRKIGNELIRYENTLTQTLSRQPILLKENLPEFKKLFLSLLSPASNKPKAYDFLSYFSEYLAKLEKRKQSNYKSYKTCYNYLKAYSLRKMYILIC